MLKSAAFSFYDRKSLKRPLPENELYEKRERLR
jgi:hypothetical protein